ncbi:hypothetical protein Cgig2_001971 [Carnegiea gigantea]|uniref:H(+)-transporting two-sector ATPase n=1 Tax=Carnegiea gigantea TaxID=171969 RepID=A0A9Q1JWC3_9CARY|nr:hypothetical protein Cgig2_001971 [Carnegiea gigantea]
MELTNSIAKAYGGVSVFGKVGERTCEGNDLYKEMKESGVISEQNIAKSKVNVVYGSEVSALLENAFCYGISTYSQYQNGLVTRKNYFYKRRGHNFDSSSYIPVDNLTYPASAMTFAHLDATTILPRGLATKDIYPVVDPLDSMSTMLQPLIIGKKHYETASIYGPGKYVGLLETIGGFQLILSEELDSLPEQAFYLVVKEIILPTNSSQTAVSPIATALDIGILRITP